MGKEKDRRMEGGQEKRMMGQDAERKTEAEIKIERTEEQGKYETRK